MADVRDFLFEIGTEEMPSAPLMNAAKQLDKLVSQALDASGLAAWGDPHRIVPSSTRGDRRRRRDRDRGGP